MQSEHAFVETPCLDAEWQREYGSRRGDVGLVYERESC